MADDIDPDDVAHASMDVDAAYAAAGVDAIQAEADAAWDALQALPEDADADAFDDALDAYLDATGRAEAAEAKADRILTGEPESIPEPDEPDHEEVMSQIIGAAIAAQAKRRGGSDHG